MLFFCADMHEHFNLLNNPPCCAEKHLQGMARAASGYHKVLAENRILYNEVQDLKGIFLFCSKEQS